VAHMQRNTNLTLGGLRAARLCHNGAAGGVLASLATQTAAVQVSFALQTCPHLPQLLGSVAVAVHFPAHADSPALHEIAHWLFVQSVAPFMTAGHIAPHLPQFIASTVISRHWPPQATRPLRHANPH
jgi:hypothetical protein